MGKTKKKKLKSQASKKDVSKIINPLIITILIIYGIYKVINLIVYPTSMFMIENGAIIKEESSVGYVIRDEKIAKGNGSSNQMIHIKAEGEKVSKGSQIFRYTNENEDEINTKIEELNSKIQEALLRAKGFTSW